MRVFLCEKPSQGKDIARVLGASGRGDGCIRGQGVVVTWGIGHLLEQAPPETYDPQLKSWSLDTLPILPASWKVEVKSQTSSQFKVVKALLREATELVIATDADREGEMIARELLEHCGYRGPIQRLWLSALNDASIRQALASLKPGAETFLMYHSALARSRADWLIGMNFTRLFTLLGRQAGYSGVLSVGRVQTPTLRLVVDRDREIAHFVPVPFWSLDVLLAANGQTFTAQWRPSRDITDDEGRCLDQRHAQAAQARVTAGSTAIAISVDTERVREVAPLPFDLGTLQEICSKRLSLGAQETLNIAQALYETHKATTYPRTDCGYLPTSMLPEVPAVLEAIRRTDPSIAPVVASVDPTLRSRAWNDAKITAHHGIIPTLEPANLAAMSEKERAVYSLIRAHYLAQFMPHHEFDRTVADFDCNQVALRAVGKRIVIPGWKALFQASPDDDDEAQERNRAQILPPLQNASRAQVQQAQLKAQQTQPPKPYTEGDLIKAMKTVAKLVTDPRLAAKLKETTGIGTEATRASIIQGLIDRQFLLKKGKAVRASEAGISLIAAVPAAVADPATTAIWEQALDMIEAGTMGLDDFITKQGTWISKLVAQYRQTTLSIKVPEGPACPLCQGKMAQRKGKNGDFWSCLRYPDCKGLVNIETSQGKGKSGPGKAQHRSTSA
ncbi:DNA topoisomerase III [Pseudomonas oryzihabitans]|uniref:DNA topoisomerase III n=1 Tax=Pseudomonas oryzihabitans TaxID=47885 RepID=UPI00285AA6A7|nr:DNA topoisomerase III [Pseudomonas psychrotolerans]MDR6680228.1 DNA topoisomerase-3 [Pseudomonas psychrotolerans]